MLTKNVPAVAISCLLLIVLTGCASSPQDLISNAKYTKSETIKENYQQVYSKVYSKAKQCLEGAINLTVSNVVDGQVFGELGYAEVSYYQRNLSPIYYATVRMEKVTDSESELTIHTGGQPKWASEKLGERFVGWASGNSECK